MKTLLALFFVLLFSCGEEEKKQVVAEPGKNSSCVTVTEGNEIVHRCMTGDGLVTETRFTVPVDGKDGKDGKNGNAGAPGKDGVDGLPGKDAVAGSAICKLKWDTSEKATNKLTLVVMNLNSNLSMSFIREYEAGAYKSTRTESVMWPASVEDRYVTDNVFTATYRGECMATVSLKLEDELRFNEMDCECKGEI